MRDIFTKLWKLADLQKKRGVNEQYNVETPHRTTKWKGQQVVLRHSRWLYLHRMADSHTHHLDLSFSLGGWKLLLDINIRALKQSFKISQAEKCLSCSHTMSNCYLLKNKAAQIVSPMSSSALSRVCLEVEYLRVSSIPTHLIGWRSYMGGWSSASSMAVIPTAQISHRWLYPPFFSTAATSGAILDKYRYKQNIWQHTHWS